MVYAVTTINGSKNASVAEKYVVLLLGPQGQAVMKSNGFGDFNPPYAVHIDAMPPELKSMVKPWPGQ